ncbi:unnamed protein product [Didymodactylos carnosus]|uniref:Integrase catalytic domain-containing protein n=1 Tax=Didymodactylos carnosus TaxID=1234261 RepID=A0A815RQJ3_9BILA|nr:unnamed protein product [Didymodactylos carnosus]CAF4343838.1 unnamed protein product [Didymodactylos carnosus]
MAQFYRRFIPKFSNIAAPLNVFKNKNAKFVWTEECQLAYDTLKNKLSQYPLLAYHDGRSPLKLSIDASGYGIGGVLHKITEEGDRPILFLSRTMTTAEQKYSNVERECLALVWCITKLRPYLYGQHFTLLTDHHPLCWLNKQTSKNGRLDRWALQLQDYEFSIKHVAGKHNCVADCLSRYPMSPPDTLVQQKLDEVCTITANPSISPPIFDSTKIKEEQLKNVKMTKMHFDLAAGVKMDQYELQNDVIHKIIHRGKSILKLPYIPPNLIQPLLQAYHNHPTAGHLGVVKTWYKIRYRYFWPGMFKSIKSYVKSCQLCHEFKISRTKPAGLLKPIEQPSGILDLMGLDFIGPVPISTTGNKYILVCVDYLSKYAITCALPDCTAESAAKFLVEKVILQFGVPQQLITDNGSHFMAKLFEAVASRCGVHHIKATTYHPQTNGLTERMNATIAASIGAYVNQQPSDRDEFLPFITFAYNTSRQESTKMAPFTLMFGRDPTLPFDIPKGIVALSAVNDYYLQLRRFLDQAKSTARYSVKQQQDIYKTRFDTGRRDMILQVGQKVFLKQMMAKNLRKFSPKFYGPFEVMKQEGRLNYVVKHVNDGHIEKAHVSRISPI